MSKAALVIMAAGNWQPVRRRDQTARTGRGRAVRSSWIILSMMRWRQALIRSFS